MKKAILIILSILSLIGLMLSWMTFNEDYGAFFIILTAFCVIFMGFVFNEDL